MNMVDVIFSMNNGVGYPGLHPSVRCLFAICTGPK